MTHTAPPAKFLVEPFELRKASAVLMTAIAMIEASHASRAGRPFAFIMGQALLAPLVRDLVNLAAACAHTAANYEACEAALTPRFLKDFERYEPALMKAAAGVVFGVETALGIGETAVSVTRGIQESGVQPKTVTGLLGILQRAANTRQIGISVAEGQAGRAFTVYLPGTQNWQPLTGTQAFDLTSDIAAMAGPGKSAPERATLQALKGLGFGSQPGDTVVLVGYSEGGLVGANLIASGALAALGGKVAGLVAVGSPVNGVPIGVGTRVISIEHANDPVTKLDLSGAPTSKHWFTQKLNPVGLLGHSLSGYLGSLDGLTDAQRVKLDNQLTQMGSGSEDMAETKSRLTWFHVERVPAG